jgi:hypothetical protein
VSDPADGAVAPPPPEEHFRTLAMRAEDLVVFLGAGANSDGADRPWEMGSGRLPDDQDLARYIADKAGLNYAPLELSRVAQQARAAHGEARVFDWLVESLALGDDTTPSAVDKLLAGLPNAFTDAGLKPRYQMIVTTKYDGGLEKAFRDAGEPFDVAVYLTPRSDRAGAFLHVPWDGRPRRIEQPNVDQGFPIAAKTRELTRTVIVRLSCSVDDAAMLEREDTDIPPPGGDGLEHIVPEVDIANDVAGSQSNGPYPADFQGFINDPNSVLRNAIAEQDILGTITIQLSTENVPNSVGNIPFLGAPNPAQAQNPGTPNAFVSSSRATFWIEWVRIDNRHPGNQPPPAPPGQPQGPFPGQPTFLQLQYSQLSILIFNGVLWPHINVATLRLIHG